MRWFQGGIAAAVTLSRNNNSIFVVYIEAKCAESEKITKLIDQDQVSNQLSSDHFVAIKIDAESVAHHQFAEIYKKVNAPSIFFIGTGGVPLEIIEHVSDLDDLLQKIEKVKQKSGIKLLNSANAASDFIESERNDSECENGVCKINTPNSPINEPEVSVTANDMPSTSVQPEETSESIKSEKSELSKEERIEKAKELIEKNKEIKKKEEEEKERMKEMERRKMGQDVQKMKRWQEDQEFKQMVEAREKEKKEQQAARQRVLEQIQQDKADRAARFSSQQPNSPQAVSAVPKSTPNSNIARIQFKLPDGSAHNHEFSPDTTLCEVRSYIRANITLASSNFLLATMFPRKEFSDEDDLKSLRELELYPSAVLLILPLSHGAVSTNGSGMFSALIWSFIGPILNLLSYIKGMLFGTKQPKDNAATSTKRPAEQGETSRTSPKRKVGETTAIRRQGNIHRLTDRTDSDDENNTWNGNSTQQM